MREAERKKPRLSAVKRAFARVRERLPLTNLGLLVTALAAAAYLRFGIPRADYVIQLVGAVALLLVALAVLAVLPGAYLVHRAFKQHTERDRLPVVFEARRGFTLVLRMPSFRLIPVLDVSWTWTEPEGFVLRLVREDGEIIEQVEALERAATDTIVRRFVIEDAFGLARVVLTRTEKRTVRALPWTGRLSVAPMLRSHVGGDDIPHPMGELDGDRVDMRPYTPGDPLRLALWKIYARTRELMVRTPERAISPSVRIVAYLPAAAGDEPPAAAARVAVESGLLGDGWIFSADGANHPAKEKDEAVALIAGSRAARGTDRGEAAGLGAFLEEYGEGARTRLLLFVPALPGPWLDTVAGAIAHRQGPVTALIATDGVRDPDEERKEKPLDRWLKLPGATDDSSTTSRAALMEVAERLAAAGAHVVAVERPLGRQLNLGIRARAKRVA